MGIIVVFSDIKDPSRITSREYGLLRVTIARHFGQKIHIVRVGNDAMESAIDYTLRELEHSGTLMIHKQLEDQIVRAAFGTHSLDDVLAFVLPPENPLKFAPEDEWGWLIRQFPSHVCGYELRPRADGNGRWLDWTGVGTKVL